ncbi:MULTISPECIES: class I SAM-dependent methyltransferase [unclassified Nocardioides]|uniref:class I SAM-dependent methyltransferase n=1 Tax=unclassified Nocardioides TaxID=2615069 RepID=UPI0006F75822|nr:MULTISPECIES: class I SAM-dependent methyltransferase [unclassified Nocardioides]KRA38188.1 SAM-dependent methyltransferase [Nocardioides sp. Root614]KRA92148.1 SAM-dependent methyltransferase [Nocardioides sp. Root682]
MALFEVSATAYARFMGRFSSPLAPTFADFALPGIAPTGTVLDVGSGPGMLTTVLADRQGATRVAAVDPVATFVRATAQAVPGADVRIAQAEELPFADASFDAALAQLVVHFMRDPAAGITEMARVTRPGGRVSACVWDHAGGTGPLASFWEVAKRADPTTADEGDLPGTAAGQLAALLEEASLREVVETSLDVEVPFATFEEWWEPFTLGVGPAGQHVANLDEDGRALLVELLRAELGDGPFTIRASAWAATGLR